MIYKSHFILIQVIKPSNIIFLFEAQGKLFLSHQTEASCPGSFCFPHFIWPFLGEVVQCDWSSMSNRRCGFWLTQQCTKIYCILALCCSIGWKPLVNVCVYCKVREKCIYNKAPWNRCQIQSDEEYVSQTITMFFIREHGCVLVHFCLLSFKALHTKWMQKDTHACFSIRRALGFQWYGNIVEGSCR